MQLVVTIVEARQLAGQTNMNPFVEVHCDEDSHTTDTQFGTNHPYFNAVRITRALADFKFPVGLGFIQVRARTSECTVCALNDVRADVLVRLQHAAHSTARPHPCHPRIHEGPEPHLEAARRQQADRRIPHGPAHRLQPARYSSQTSLNNMESITIAQTSQHQILEKCRFDQ